MRLRGSQFRAKMRVVLSDSDSLGSCTVELTARQWQIIDDTLDNEVSVDTENGDPRGDVECRTIRDHVGSFLVVTFCREISLPEDPRHANAVHNAPYEQSLPVKHHFLLRTSMHEGYHAACVKL
ncbi:hypothetical protein GA0070624_3168 [Micromonospora rhizosphaerae]|uniref:Uncharacterized protein n=1 Tax=Micromonospora rhizosphaerae TaxID=568872 RepID=A0A1C6S8M6_9ACTN|nr:hypothetical protein GA0070624_3168 [Micromonospora rhizosphaerae]